jgi:hypothetical protein
MKWVRGVSRLLIIQLCIAFPLACFTQDVQFSSSAQLFMKRLGNYKKLNAGSQNEISELQREFGLSISNGKVVVGAILKVNEKIDLKKLKKLGTEINTTAGGILSVKIPVYKLKKLKKVKGLLLVDVDVTVKAKE